ncbi:alcohol dehydrogenase catalytic domain-containing protein [Buttiauxella selenatireducens]|uniref:Alcohol dehydrogenase catalytic domain-containing protein n=1 Tax=Buttiauxella selenatireducens TaxID=3073902 RepID=A0ABY9S628_9ENTR|nr:alcohol dehydrogenase catalytic domain-containing protein [Buttiauxella sp. R73]WMY72581.1 alcohol dehydrogenase catalytic domain-containing protein [Buttiauxella sp. R73]
MQKQNSAWRWSQPGEPTGLIQTVTRISQPDAHQVLVANRVAGLNPVDWKFIEQPSNLWESGHIPGVDGMGVIVAVGSRVNHLRVGSRVCYHTSLREHGSFSHHTLVSAKAVIPVPDSISDLAAAALPCPGLTAWQAMKKLPELKGKRVLVSGAGGSVGSILTQLLIAQGAQVYVTASRVNHDRLKLWGVIHAFDYKDHHWHQQLRQQLGGQSLYAALDMVSGEHTATLAPLLGYYGHLVCVQDRVSRTPLAAFSTCISVHEIALGAMHQYGDDLQWAELVRAGQFLLAEIGRGAIVLPEFDVTGFGQLPESLAKLKRNNKAVKYLVHTED